MISPIPESDHVIHRQRNWVATIATLVVLGLLGAFTWKVVIMARQIQNGTLDTSILSSNGFTSSLRLAAIPREQQPVDVVSTDDPSLGRKDAPLTIVEFADFGCPFSREVSFTMRELAIKYPEKIHYIYRDFPITELHPMAQKAAEAGECAGKQGRFWEYHDKLYQNQNDLSASRLLDFAAELGLNGQAFQACLDSGVARSEVEQDYEVGFKAGVRGTPTFFINGNRIEGAIPKDLLEQLITSTP